MLTKNWGGAEPTDRLTRFVIICAISYVPATYLYWAVMKMMGVLLFGAFQFKDRFAGAPHGYIDFWQMVCISPISVPIDLLVGLVSLPACGLGYAEPNMGGSPRNFVFVLAAFVVAMALVACAVWVAWRMLRTATETDAA